MEIDWFTGMGGGKYLFTSSRHEDMSCDIIYNAEIVETTLMFINKRNDFSIFFLVVVGFVLRASRLLGRHSTT
jgi:hypothetical protein